MDPVSEKTLFKSISKIGKSNDKVVGIGIYAKIRCVYSGIIKKSIRERIKDSSKNFTR